MGEAFFKCECAFGVLRFGTERLYAQKEDLLHEVLELEAEKGLLASGENTKYQVGVALAERSRLNFVTPLGQEMFLYRRRCSALELEYRGRSNI